MTPAEQFFYDNAGYSWDPNTETREEGRIRCAKELALAEAYAKRHDWSVVWEPDWEIGNHQEFYGGDLRDGEPATCEVATLYDEHGECLASLGCIDDATDEYRRVVAAQLALGVLPQPGDPGYESSLDPIFGKV